MEIVADMAGTISASLEPSPDQLPDSNFYIPILLGSILCWYDENIDNASLFVSFEKKYMP